MKLAEYDDDGILLLATTCSSDILSSDVGVDSPAHGKTRCNLFLALISDLALFDCAILGQ